MAEVARAPDTDGPTSVAELLELTALSANIFLAPPARLGRRALYGGQLVAQALRAAANTVPQGRTLHSMHAYFLRPGEPNHAIQLRVERDSDGGRYSMRRVTASQSTDILGLACSFAHAKHGPDFQVATMPTVQPPADLPVYPLDSRRTFDLEARVPDDQQPWYRWPAMFWVRIREPLGDDPNAHACGLMFLSDLCTGLSRAPSVEDVGLMPSLDHAVWLHRPARVNDWVLLDLNPESTGAGRGMYTGRIFQRDGTLLATLAQESLFDPRRGRPVPGFD